MSEPWPSTKGLSVYNALSLGGDMTPDQIVSYLRTHWDPDISRSYVDDGLSFIAAKSWVSVDGESVRLLTRPQRAIRANADADLELVHK